MIIMGALNNVVCTIVEHCRLNNKGLDNFVFNDDRDNGRQYY